MGFFSGALSLFAPPLFEICYVSVSISHALAFHVLYLIRLAIHTVYELLQTIRDPQLSSCKED